MSMKLSQLRTYWDAEDAHLIISFLDELKEVLWDKLPLLLTPLTYIHVGNLR